MGGIRLQRGALWRSLLERTDSALGVGSLLPIPTEHRFIEDGGVRFVVRVASNLDRKRKVSTYTGKRPGDGTTAPPNPFLPYDEDMFVADVSETHVALLNKFNVVEHHLLIVTRSFEDQESPLTLEDFEATWACMAEYDALVFYNSGEVAGASQRHKHLQMVPLPLTPGIPGCPIDPVIAPARSMGSPGPVPGLPFAHCARKVAGGVDRPPSLAARETLEAYREMLGAVGLDVRRPDPYNLLVTRAWMLLVPRSRECFGSISVNALGFAGSFFVKNESDLALLTRRGPMAALASVAGRSGDG